MRAGVSPEAVKNGRDWLDAYRKRIVLSVVSILTATIVVTLFFIAYTLRARLMRESTLRAEELGTVLHSSLSHLMEARNPGKIQQTLVDIQRENPSLVRTMILDDRGRVAYSTDPADIGTVIDRFTDPSCRGCHRGPVTVPREKTTIISVDGKPVQRYVHLIPNEPPCHRCHRPDQRINGKLIIDRSLAPTRALIGTIILLVSGLGALSLAVLIPILWRYLSHGVNTYITEVRQKSSELMMLYGVVERLSATIELEQLKRVIIEIVSEVVEADEIDLVLPSDYKESGVMVWAKAGSVIDRKKVEPGSTLRAVIQRWTEGAITNYAVAAAGREVHLPIAKGGHRLALIIVRSARPSYGPVQMPMVRAMANHIAVAFENAMLYHLAITDELTGLYSNRHFRQVVRKRYEAFEEFGEKTALLMIDIDDFKKVNDTYGHPAGDTILKDVARCIMSSIREDDLAFRYGGEEFAVILPESDTAAGAAVAERARSLIEHSPSRAELYDVRVTVSIGVSSWPASAENIKDLIREADRGLYEAKHSGKNRVVVRKQE